VREEKKGKKGKEKKEPGLSFPASEEAEGAKKERAVYVGCASLGVDLHLSRGGEKGGEEEARGAPVGGGKREKKGGYLCARRFSVQS